MRIVKLEWRNIFSYGNKIESIEFDGKPMLWLLTGASGAGKTSFLTIPKLLFYGRTDGSDGKPFKVADVANRLNKHGWIRGTVEKDSNTYVIERTFSPSGLTIEKNGENLDVAGLKNMQEIIDNEILGGLPYNIFSNVMSLSLNNFKSFVSMSPADKRSIIDNIFSLGLINKVHELISADRRATGNSINESKSALFQIEKNIGYSQSELDSIVPKKSAEEYSKEKTSAVEKINKLGELHTQQSDLYKEYYAKYAELQQTESTLNILVSKENVEIQHLNEKIRLFNEDKCPTCGTPFSGDSFDELRDNLNKNLQERQSNIDTYNTQLSDVRAAMSQYVTALSEIQNNINAITEKVREFEYEIKRIDVEMSAPDEYQSIKNLIDKNTREKAAFETDIAGKTESMRYLEYLDQIYSADGIKAQMMSRYIPTLNAEIQDTLSFLAFPYTLTFDGNFDPHIEHLGQEIGPQTLSCGEHKKVDLTVLCSILRMVKRKYPQINIVCLDETVSSLDTESSTEIIKYLKKTADEMGMNVFIVSHTQLDESLFDRHIHVDKVDSFSELKLLKN